MNERQLNEVLGLVKDVRLWVQAEKNRNTNVPMRSSDWDWIISHLMAVEEIIDPSTDFPVSGLLDDIENQGASDA